MDLELKLWSQPVMIEREELNGVPHWSSPLDFYYYLYKCCMCYKLASKKKNIFYTFINLIENL